MESEQKMKIRTVSLWMALCLFLAAGSLRAQTAPAPAPLPATPPVNHFVITANVAGFMGVKGSPGTASILTAAMQIMPSLSAGYEHIGIGNTRWELGVVAYTKPLSSLLGSKLSSKLLFDASQVNFTFSGGGGKLLQPTVNTVAETAGFHISYPITDHLALQIVGVDFLHSTHTSGFLTTNTTQTISSGINVYF
jgi:hypothetical protein